MAYTAEVLDVDVDRQGNIIVATKYMRDTQQLETGHTCYSFHIDATPEAIDTKIRTDIDAHLNHVIVRDYIESKNASEKGAVGALSVGYKASKTKGTFIAYGNTNVTDGVTILSAVPA